MCFLPGRAATRCPQAGATEKTCGAKKHLFAARSAGGPGECAITGQLPRPPFSLVPSTARSLFGGTKRECGVGTVGSYGQAALPGWHRRRRLLGRDGAAPQNCPQAALGPRWRSAPGKPVSTAYIETYRQAKSGLNGTFDRAKVPKARWGVSKRPRPLTTPLGDLEGPRRRASPAR